MLSNIESVKYIECESRNEPRFSTLVHIFDSIEVDQQSKLYNMNEYMVADLTKLKQVTFYQPLNQPSLKKVLLFTVDLKQDGTKAIRDVAKLVSTTLQSQKCQQFDLLFPKDLDNQLGCDFMSQFQLTNYKAQQKGVYGDEEEQKTQLDKLFKPFTDINFLNFDVLTQDFQFAFLTSHNTNLCKYVGGSRGNMGNIQDFLDYTLQLASLNNVTRQTLVGQELVDAGLLLHHAVGRGSIHPPALINLFYQGNPSDKENIVAFVGKGIVFDSGGLNIKATGAIEGMFLDKCGAAGVLLAFKSVVQAELQVNLTCTLAMAENFVGDDAFRPSDIIKSLKGITVEIGNTDAEGRLVLSDCMTWTQKTYKPHTLIDMATLTGASMVALGLQTGAVFSNCDKLAQDLITNGQKANEALWRLPITQEHRDVIKGAVGDIKNHGGTYGGACTAASFLECFVEKGVNWAHLDIAGPAGIYPNQAATGFGVQLLFNYIRQLSSQNKQ